MIKKLFLGAFIVYNVFAMSGYAVAANTFEYKTAVSDARADQKEVATNIYDLKQSSDFITQKDESIDASDSKDSEKSDDKNSKDKKTSDDILVATDSVGFAGCDSTGTPSVIVISPNGGEVFTTGQQITVKWETCNIPSGMNALIILNDEINSIGGDLATSTPNDGVEVVTLPTSTTWPGPFGTYFKVRVSFVPFGGYPGTQLSDASDNVFTINSTVTTPSITVTSPNGGEVYTPGQQITVTWTSQNLPPTENVSINITSDQPPLGGLTSTVVPNTGSAQYTLPNAATLAFMGWSLGTHFKIGVTHFIPNTTIVDASDLSDNLFTINSGVTYPAGCTGPLGYSPITGVPCTNPVTWIAGCTSANGYSMTTGQPCNWTIVYPNVPQGCVTNQGFSFSVTTGQPCSGGNTFCNPDDSTTVPAVDVLSPNGGEHFLPAEMPVTWRTCLISSNTLMKIDLVMSLTGSPDLTRHLITTTNDGAQNVSLPNITSWPQMVYGNNFKVKISLASGPSYGPSDQSNGNFRIAPASVIVSTASNTPPAGIVQVNNTASTNDVVLLKFQVKATDSDLTIRKIPIQIITNSGNVSAKIKTIKIIKDNNVVDAISGSDGYLVSSGVITSTPTTGATTTGYIFDNLSAPWDFVPEGTTSNFTIAVDIKALAGNYNEGDTLTAAFTSGDALLTSNFSVLDNNGDQLALPQRSGFTQGQTQLLRL